MLIAITSNIKKHFKNHCDFIDYYWINFFEKKKINFIILPNSINASNFILEKLKKKIDLIILSGGNDVNSKNKIIKNRLKIESLIIKFSIKNKLPILGVCRGMQVLNLFFGGSLIKLKKHMRNVHEIKYLDNNIFIKKNKIKVNSFHNYGIKKNNLGNNLIPVALASDNSIEEFKHKKYKIYGTMWHPEREIDYIKLFKLIKFLK